MTKIHIHFAEGFEEIEAITAVDVLKRAEYDVTMVSITEKKEVYGAHDIQIICDQLFEDVNYTDVDMILLPGGMPGAKNLDEHEGLKAQIKQFNDSGKLLGAICAAPMVFGHLGILKGGNATCYPGFEEHLKGVNVTGKAVEVSGNIITGKGPGASFDFSLAIVEIISGKEKAAKLRSGMVIE